MSTQHITLNHIAANQVQRRLLMSKQTLDSDSCIPHGVGRGDSKNIKSYFTNMKISFAVQNFILKPKSFSEN